MHKIRMNGTVIWALLILGYCLYDALCQSSCAPAEEGKEYTIVCYGATGTPPVTAIWRDPLNKELIYCSCTIGDEFPGCGCQQDYNATLEGSATQGYTSVLTIRTTHKNLTGTTFVCELNGSVRKACDLNVFARAKNATCQVQDPGPTSKRDVVVTCEDDDIFPGAACQFSKKTNNNTPSTLPDGSVETSGKTCTLRVPGTDLGRGDHQFKAVMYPNITNVTYGVTSGYTDVIKLGDPSGELRDCPTVINDNDIRDGYIKEGTTAVACTCARTSTDPTYFPVDISWKNQPTQSATLTFTATKNQAFTCNVKNSLQWTTEVPYTPQVAYGPSNGDVTVEPPSQRTIHLCHAGGETFTVQCKVSSSGVVPNATFSYTVSPAGSVVPQTSASGSTNTATVTVTSAGTNVITCLAKNSLFPVIQGEKSVSVEVTEPPSAPTIEIFQTMRGNPTNGGKLTVEEGGANVTCHVTGGYPPQVKAFRLSCGENKTFNNPGNEAQMSLSFTRNMNGRNCSCMATHDSTCYSNNTVSYVLNVVYPPSVKTFSVEHIGSGTVEKGSTLTFVCQAEGNPHPALFLQHDGVRGNVTNITTDGDTTVTTLTHNLTMDCLDTGVYTCTAQAQKIENSSTVGINVLCPQQLESSQSQNTVYDREINSTFDIDVRVYGYPKPTSQLHGHEEDLQEHDYSINYTETKPPHGVITLTFYSLTEKYFQNYTLNVTNTKGSLLYNFRISGDVGSSDKGESKDLNAAAIGGGIAAAILVILIIVLVVFIVRRKGNPCARKGDSSRKAGQDEEHVIPNDLYAGANSGEVVIDNSDLYSGNWNRKSNEVVIDNSDLYSGFSKPGSKEVVVDNSALYGKSDDFKETREALYKNYTDVTPSMTSATAVPVDMKAFNGAKQGGNSSYEDVEVGAKSSGPSVQPKPKVAVKPMTAAKPTPAPKPGGPSTSGPQGAIVLQDDGVDQTYASVVKPVKPQAPKPQPTNQRESDYFPDQSKKPEVPEKKYEQEESLTGQEGKKKEQKSGGDKKKKNKKADEIPMVPKGGAAGSSSHDNPYVNGGYAEDDGNVYANATGARAAPKNSDNVRTNEGPYTGRYKNKDGLVYTTVELMPQPTGQRKPKIMEDKVNYSQITFDGKS